MPIYPIRTVKQKFTRFLLDKPNVVAVGVGTRQLAGLDTGEPCVVVSVSQKVPGSQLTSSQQVPQMLEGVRTDVQETGLIHALQGRAERWRPAPGGVSIGHTAVTAGTLGCLVYREVREGPRTLPYILSNNHVLANSNQGRVGDAIVQPGAYDGGQAPADQIATLKDFVPVRFDFQLPDCPVAAAVVDGMNTLAKRFHSVHRFGTIRQNDEPNLVDAALARPLSDDLVTSQILEIGFPTGTAEGELGVAVQKSGRTTALTQGKITQVDVTVRVLYGAAFATFEDQLAGDLRSDGGDSGSAVLDAENRVVGLLFAGGTGITIFNRIQNVEAALGFSVVS